jgi:hypothetical protein
VNSLSIRPGSGVTDKDKLTVFFTYPVSADSPLIIAKPFLLAFYQAFDMQLDFRGHFTQLVFYFLHVACGAVPLIDDDSVPHNNNNL